MLAAFSDKAPCRTKVRRSPSAAALEEAVRLRSQTASDVAKRVVIDLSHYVSVADQLRHNPTHDNQERESE